MIRELDDTVQALLRRRQWQDVEFAIEVFARLFGLPPTTVFNRSISRILGRHVAHVQPFDERAAVAAEAVRLCQPEVDAVSLGEAIAALRLAADRRDALDAFSVLDDTPREVH
jgi:hypothetical protein